MKSNPELNDTGRAILKNLITILIIQVKPHKVRLTGTDPDGTSFYASIPLDGIPVNLHLTGSNVTVGQTSSHSDRATLTTDVNGNVLIFTNSHIQGLYNLHRF
jgi:hypothetical protein